MALRTAATGGFLQFALARAAIVFQTRRISSIIESSNKRPLSTLYRLYNAPVESDIRSRPPPKSPVHSRSAIRRAYRGRHEGGEWAEARQRVLAHEIGRLTRESISAADEMARVPPWDLGLLHPAREGTPSMPSNRPGARSLRPALPHDPVARRSGGLDERSVAVIGERWANLYTRAGHDVSLADRGVSSNMRTVSGREERERVERSAQAPRRIEARGSRAPRSRARVLITGRMQPRSLYSSNIGRSSNSPPSPPPPPPDLGSLDRPNPVRERTHLSPTPDRYVPAATTATAPTQSARLDGLGDRNRSLSMSPAEDGWDTLLTTLAPDPQPSVGSSFASTSASLSAATSHGVATGSSANTSMTGRDAVADGSMSDPNCESGCENSDTEGDDDEDDEDTVRLALSRFPGSGRTLGHRSYAEVAGRTGSNSSGGEDPLEFLGDMQRIVRHFARREDIPDEWWAEVGLSRTLSRASN
ncbi:hypothetical protein RB595_009494 [Gaeumannomyces hyphopodioides]